MYIFKTFLRKLVGIKRKGNQNKLMKLNKSVLEIAIFIKNTCKNSIIAAKV